MFVVGCVGGEELFILQQFAAFLGWYQRTLSIAVMKNPIIHRR